MAVRAFCLVASALLAMSARPCTAGDLTPCDAYGAADAVFVGQAGAVVTRRAVFNQPEPVPVELELMPFSVERAFRGVSTPVVYITPAGGPGYDFVPGQRYLVYGHRYHGRDMFFSAFSYGSKRVEDASRDLEFLEVVAGDSTGVTISGSVDLLDGDPAAIGPNGTPLPATWVVLADGSHQARALTGGDGRFMATGLASGTYTADVQLPPDLALVKEPAPIVEVRAGGCAALRLRVVPNGHIRGIMMTVDGQPVRFASVALMDGPLRSHRDGYRRQVDTDAEGRFAIDGVPPGTYVLGRLSANVDGVIRPAVYYPGTSDWKSAGLVVVGRATDEDVGTFLVPVR